MTRTVRLFAMVPSAVLAALVAVGGPLALAQTRPDQDTDLQAALDRWASAPAHHGVSASVIFADGRQWIGTAGEEGGGAPIRPEHLFWLASITKTMTGAVILQLAEARRLSLDDPISRWLPARPNIDGRITVRQLMNHTSGVASYTGAILRTKSDPKYVFSADELLDTVPPMAFAPGTRTQYSNTAFVVLASVAERVTGQPMHRLLRERLWAPLGFTEIFMIGHEPPPGSVARAFNGTTFVQPLDNLSQSSGGHGAGAVFASARTVARWGRALFTGTVVSPATQRAMRTLVPAAGNIPGESGAGLGIRGYNFLGRQQYGHSGGAVLGNSLFVFDPDSGVTVAVLTNQGQGADHFTLVPALLEIATRR